MKWFISSLESCFFQNSSTYFVYSRTVTKLLRISAIRWIYTITNLDCGVFFWHFLQANLDLGLGARTRGRRFRSWRRSSWSAITFPAIVAWYWRRNWIWRIDKSKCGSKIVVQRKNVILTRPSIRSTSAAWQTTSRTTSTNNVFTKRLCQRCKKRIQRDPMSKI